ncbi:MAG: SseB family protein [Oligoflexia bacterium]|nr:SseB family protein [Oligoflexia bacterium]
MEQSLAGDRKAARDFYLRLPTAMLIAPERYQAQKLSDAPQYPDEFFNFLGVKSQDRVIVPVFTQTQLVEEWSGAYLKHREIAGSELMKRLPEGWWICINPGQEVEKELSPWEIQKLLLGPEEIDEILEELFTDLDLHTVSVKPVDSTENKALVDSLVKLAEECKTVQRVYLLADERADLEGTTEQHFLLGIEVERASPEDGALAKRFKLAAEHGLIGIGAVRVFIADLSDTQVLGMFRVTKPIFERQQTKALISRIISLFTRK